MRQGHWAPRVRRPSCLQREVSRDDLFVQGRRHRAWTRIDVYGSANNGADEAGRKARCGSVFEARAAQIGQHDAAVAPAGRAFEKPTQRFEYSRHRMAARHHFKQPFFTCEQSLSPLAIIDIRLQDAPADDPTVCIPHGKTVDAEPVVDAIGPSDAEFNVVRTPTVD